MTTLTDKLIELTLDISDKQKTVNLLSNLISEQKERHASEVINLRKEIANDFEKTEADNDVTLRDLLKKNEELSCKTKELEVRVKELTVEKQEAERNKKLRIDAIKRDFVDTKEREHILYQQQKAMREKAWFDKRLSEIKQTTFKGIQPNIDRLMRKHQEECEDIKCQTDVTKQKLKLTCEDDLMSRLAEFQNNVQQSKDSTSNMNKISKSLAHEQNEHRTRIKIVKESLLEEEQNLRQMYDMEQQSLIEQNSGELNKIKLSNSIQYLEKNLRSKMEQMEYEMKSELQEIDRGLALSKQQWEDAWLKKSSERKFNEKQLIKKKLIDWRELTVNEIIRKSVIEQREIDYQKTPSEFQMNIAHNSELESLHTKLTAVQSQNKNIRVNIIELGNLSNELQSSMYHVKQDLDAACAKLDEVSVKIEREKQRHKEILTHTCLHFKQSLDLVNRRQEECKLEINRIKTEVKNDLSNHCDKKTALQKTHHLELDNLEQQATEAVSELDRKLLAQQNIIKEKETYLIKAQDLFRTKYKQ